MMDDRERRQSIRAEIEQAKSVTKPGWTTYEIRDPSQRDKAGHPDGPPAYVGVTNNFGRRVDQRMKSSGRRTGGKDNIDRLLNGVMRRGAIPRFCPIEQTATRLDSLVSETNCARRLINEGYRLANQWAEHKCGGPDLGRSDVPHQRLWEFMIVEAIGSDITVALRCKPCGIDIKLDWQCITDQPEPPKRLRDIRDSLSCPSCGAKSGRYAKLVVPRDG